MAGYSAPPRPPLCASWRMVLMDNHYHLMLELVESHLSRAVQWLNVSYSI